jgi:hypothetical protein
MTNEKYIVEMALLLHDYASASGYEFEFIGTEDGFFIYTFANDTKYGVKFDMQNETINTIRAKTEKIEDAIENGKEFEDNNFLEMDSFVA